MATLPQIIKFRKRTDTGVSRRQNDRIQQIVVRFIDNLRNAVWMRKQAELVRVEQEKQSQTLITNTESLRKPRDRRVNTMLPIGLSNSPKRIAEPEPDSGRKQ